MQLDRRKCKAIKTPADMLARQVAKQVRSQKGMCSMRSITAVFLRCLCSDSRVLFVNEKAGCLIRYEFSRQVEIELVCCCGFEQVFAPKFVEQWFQWVHHDEHRDAIEIVFLCGVIQCSLRLCCVGKMVMIGSKKIKFFFANHHLGGPPKPWIAWMLFIASDRNSSALIPLPLLKNHQATSSPTTAPTMWASR